MSILIKGMDIPESCHDCRFCGWSNFWQVYDCHMAKPNALLLFNGEKTNSDGKTRNGRADNCPLIPVPDHGRLIDADALIRALKNQDYSGAPETLEEWTPMDMTEAEISDIKAAPTIIPASKEGEG